MESVLGRRVHFFEGLPETARLGCRAAGLGCLPGCLPGCGTRENLLVLFFSEKDQKKKNRDTIFCGAMV